MRYYADSLTDEMHRRGVEGIQKAVFHEGKRVDKGNVLQYDSVLLQMLVKRHCPEFRERNVLDMNVSGGVLVVNAPDTDPEKWKARFNKDETDERAEDQ